MNADLDTEATALAEHVIGALSTKAGPEDDRTARQRRHDALAEAFRRLIGSDLLPERGGSKPHIKADIDLATLRSLPGSKQAEEEWLDRRMAALARARLHGATTQDLLTAPPQPPDLTNPDATDQPAQPLASPQPPTSTTPNPPPYGSVPYGSAAYGGGAAACGHCGHCGTATLPAGLTGWADDRAAQSVQPVLPGLGEGAVLAGVGPISRSLASALACDSIITPTVVGAVDHDALEAMTNEWLHAHRLDGGAANGPPGNSSEDSGCGLSAEAYLRMQHSMLRWAITVLSGPGGLASYLRTRVLDGPLDTPSIVLDVGTDDKTVPAPLERAVRRRDQRCRFPGCDHPAELSQVHHITHAHTAEPPNYGTS